MPTTITGMAATSGSSSREQPPPTQDSRAAATPHTTQLLGSPQPVTPAAVVSTQRTVAPGPPPRAGTPAATVPHARQRRTGGWGHTHTRPQPHPRRAGARRRNETDVTPRQTHSNTDTAAGSLARERMNRPHTFRTRAQTAPPLRGWAVGLPRSMRHLSQADLVQIRTWATGINGATADGAGASPPRMTTNSPSPTSELVRPRLERATRSRNLSPESRGRTTSPKHRRHDPAGAGTSAWARTAPSLLNDPAGAGGPARARAPPATVAQSVRAGWSWRSASSRPHGDGRPSGRNGWS